MVQVGGVPSQNRNLTLYSCKNEENIDLDGGVSKPMMVKVYATTKDAIAQKIEKTLQVADDTVIVSYDSDKQADLLEDLDNCIKIFVIKSAGATKDGKSQKKGGQAIILLLSSPSHVD